MAVAQKREIDRSRLPEVGALIRVKSNGRTFVARYCGIIPPRPNPRNSRDRAEKLAIKGGDVSAAISVYDLDSYESVDD